MLLARLWGAVRFVPCLALVLAVGASGCSPSASDTTLSGTVKLGDAPLPAGEIKLFPQEGDDKTPRTTIIDSSGHYNFAPPVPLGAAKLTVAGPGKSSDPNAPPSTVTVNPKYADAATSGLSTTVKAGKNEFPVNLSP